jgi:hypothetical protein
MASGRWIDYPAIMVCIMLLMASCRSDRSGKQQNIDRKDTSLNEKHEEINEIKNVYYLCPSPSEMLEVIGVTNLEFDEKLPNSVELADRYLDDRTITINLGVYASDLAYCAVFGRHEQVINLLEAVQNSTKKIHLSGATGQQFAERVRQNIGSLDSLHKISDEAFIDLLEFCEKNQRYNTMVLISAGAFIESLYLAIEMAGEYNPDNYLVQHLADQKLVLDNLVAFAASHSEDPGVAWTLEILKPVEDIYDRLDKSVTKTNVKKDNPDHLLITGGIKINFSDEQYIKLLSTITEIRNKITLNENNQMLSFWPVTILGHGIICPGLR